MLNAGASRLVSQLASTVPGRGGVRDDGAHSDEHGSTGEPFGKRRRRKVDFSKIEFADMTR
jgi:hypothetical protein